MNYLKTIFMDLFQTTRSMSAKEHFKYWIFPIILSSSFIIGYYAGPPAIQDLIAPTLNREFGLLENCAHLLLLISVVFLFKKLLAVDEKRSKYILLFLLLGFAFVFLEEIDYGMHWVYFIEHVSEEGKTPVNFHNQGEETLNIVYFAGHLIMGIFFLIVPYLIPGSQKTRSWYSKFIPNQKMIFLVFSILITGLIAKYFDKQDLPNNGSLTGNRAEFDELLTYYVFLIYCVDIGTEHN